MKRYCKLWFTLLCTAAAVWALTGSAAAMQAQPPFNSVDSDEALAAYIGSLPIGHDWDAYGYYDRTGILHSDLDVLPVDEARLAAQEQPTVGEEIAAYAVSFVGYPYVYGGRSPSGFDCSGFMQYLFAQFGYEINRTATAQLADGYEVAYEEMAPGDIIYFGYGSTATHVGMYIGDGQFVHAENSGTGVVITDITADWYAYRFLTAHRIVA